MKLTKKKFIAVFLLIVFVVLPFSDILGTPASASTYSDDMKVRVGLYFDSTALSSVSIAAGTIKIGSTGTSFYTTSSPIEVGYSDGTNFTPLGETYNSSINFSASSTFSAVGCSVEEYNTQNASADRVFALRFSEGALRINGNNFYTGFLEINTSSGKLEIVNVLELGEYLKGVLPYEMSYGYQTEALKAQAIAARSWSICNLSKHSKDGFNFCSTTCCQAYRGCIRRTTKTDDTVDSTQNEVIVYNGRVAEGLYFSSSGGSTVSAKSFWGGSTAPYLQPVRIPEEVGYKTWEFTISLSELYSLLKGRIDFVSLSDGLKSFEIAQNESNSDHVIALKATDINGKSVTVSGGSSVYSLISYISRAKGNVYTSTNFDFNYAYSINVANYGETSYTGNITVATANGTETYTGSPSEIKVATASGVESSGMAPSSILVTGKGYGHGVGMSQIGANDLAKNGYDYISILKRFYTGVEIKNVTDL